MIISYAKIEILKDMGKEIHISCDGYFYNGLIKEVNKEKEFLIINDRKLGSTPVMFEEILKIEPMREERE